MKSTRRRPRNEKRDQAWDLPEVRGNADTGSKITSHVYAAGYIEKRLKANTCFYRIQVELIRRYLE